MSAHSDDAPAPVCAQNKRDFYQLFGVFAFIGVAIVIAVIYATIRSPPRADTPLWAVIAITSALLILPNLVALWILARLRVIANARGLEIRSTFKTQFIAWRDIEDYELRAAPNAATATLSWIRAGRKWQRLPQFLTKTESLRARIQTEATHSRARNWQLNIERDDAENWPKTYAYRDPNGTKMFAVVAVGLLLIVTLIFVIPDSAANSKGDTLDKWLHLAAMLLPLLLAHYALMRARKRQNSRIVHADLNGVTCVDAQNPTTIAWNEISDYFIADAKGAMTMAQHVMESTDARIEFHHDITEFGELKALVTARAVNAKSSEWKHRESADLDTIGGEASLWSGGVAGVGRKVYHYRTRTLRALLGLGGFIIFLILAGTISSFFRRPPELAGLIMSVFFFTFTLVLTLGGALAFWRGSIQTDETGVHQIGIWSERFLHWHEIEAFSYNGHFYALTGKNATIRYWLTVAQQSLHAEIEARTGLKLRRVGQSDNDE